MKKAIIIMALLLMVSISFAQEGPKRTKMFGINPLGLIFNIYSGHFGMIINDGANELNFPFFVWMPSSDFNILGAGVRYRFYKDKTGRKFFYGPLVKVLSVKWKYSSTETVNAITFTPGAEVGYRWAWDNGFTLAPSIGAGYTIGNIKASDGTEASYGGSGVTWGIGVGLAYMW